MDRCCLLAVTGPMTHCFPAESFIKCPKYQIRALSTLLPIAVISQPLAFKQSGPEGVIWVIFIPLSHLGSGDRSRSGLRAAGRVTPAHPDPATPLLPLTWESSHMYHMCAFSQPWLLPLVWLTVSMMGAWIAAVFFGTFISHYPSSKQQCSPDIIQKLAKT